MSHDLRATDSVRESADGAGSGFRAAIWRVLPSEWTVARATTRLAAAGLACLVVGLPGFLRFLSRGSTASLRTGLLAIGYACLWLAAAVPALYWSAVLCVAVSTLLVRRWLPVWRRLRSVHPEHVADPGGRLRL